MDPSEVTVVHTVHSRLTVRAQTMPESTDTAQCKATAVAAVISGEHRIVVVLKCISSVTRVPRNQYLVTECLAVYDKCTILGIVPAAIACLQVKS